MNAQAAAAAKNLRLSRLYRELAHAEWDRSAAIEKMVHHDARIREIKAEIETAKNGGGK